MRQDKGFSMVVIVVAVALGLIAAGGYVYYSKMQKVLPAPTGPNSIGAGGSAASQPTTASEASLSTTPAVITSTAGLDAATSDLDTTNVDATLNGSLDQLDLDSAGF